MTVNDIQRHTRDYVRSITGRIAALIGDFAFLSLQMADWEMNG